MEENNNEAHDVVVNALNESVDRIIKKENMEDEIANSFLVVSPEVMDSENLEQEKNNE